MTCDLALGPVAVNGPQVTECNGTTQAFAHNSKLLLIGQSTSSGVAITGSSLTVEVSRLSITSPSPFLISQSSVSIILSGSNRLASNAAERAGIECGGSSNISFSTVKGGLLTAIGGSQSPGIGASERGICNSITIESGSYAVTGGSGIGANDGSTLNFLTIKGGGVNASGSLGAGIGSGDSSVVGNITITGGIVNATGTRGAGIGAGRANSNSASVGSITIAGGTITARGFYSAAIGAGSAFSGNSTVGSITIINGNIRAAGSFGAGIGAGQADATRATTIGASQVGSITILNGHVVANGTNGAGIGAGQALASVLGISKVTAITIVDRKSVV
jgi:hypothetical protein